MGGTTVATTSNTRWIFGDRMRASHCIQLAVIAALIAALGISGLHAEEIPGVRPSAVQDRPTYLPEARSPSEGRDAKESTSRPKDATGQRAGVELPDGSFLDVTEYVRWNQLPATEGKYLKDDLPQGEARTLRDPGGGLIATLEHDDDKLHGTCEFFHPSGQKMLSGTFSRGDRTGNFTLWDENGKARVYTHHFRKYRSRYAVFCDDKGSVLLILGYTGGRWAQAHLVDHDKIIETANREDLSAASEKLQAAVADYDAYYLAARQPEGDVAEILKLEGEERRGKIAAGRADAVARQFQQRYNSRQSAQWNHIQGLRRRSQF